MTQPATSVPPAPIVQAQQFSWYELGKSTLALVGLGFLAWLAWKNLPAALEENPEEAFEEEDPEENPSMHVQSLLFDRKHWTTEKAKAWAKSHGYKYGKVHVTDEHVRLRQELPEHFEVMRTVQFGKGIKAVTGR